VGPIDLPHFFSTAITEANRAKVLSTFNRIIDEDKDKYHAYHDVYHVLKDSCDCRVPDSKILP
jgi:hypothetical protein